MKRGQKHICLFITILLLCYNNVLFTQAVSIKVVSNNLLPLHQALIQLDKSQHFTDTNGIAFIPLPATNNILIQCFFKGYAPYQQTIELNNEQSLDSVFIVQLTPLIIELETTDIEQISDQQGKRYLRAIEGTSIFAAKKTDAILLQKLNTNLTLNNARLVYAKVPGITVWEADGTGLQLGIGTRGLSPKRSANFNMRQNGYDISADALGYPESYYTPPADAIQEIDIVRGAASLQYGTQFGGLVNFKLLPSQFSKPIEASTKLTVGSNNLLASHTTLGGKVKNWSYYTYTNYKKGDGWRPNNQFEAISLFGQVHHQFSKRFSWNVEYTHMHYLAKQPGGLTDNLFEQNPRQSIRDRNWFQVNWNLFEAGLTYVINPRVKLSSKVFGLLGDKKALGFLGQINRIDPIEERDLFSDTYRNLGSETRILWKYTYGNKSATLAFGNRLYRGRTNRKQGLSDAGYNPTFVYLSPDSLEGLDFDFPSNNVAFFAEQVLSLSEQLKVTIGVRKEYINTNATGYYRETQFDLAGNVILDSFIYDERSSKRSFILFGGGMSYQFSERLEGFANISQNYRAINFNDLHVTNPNIRVNDQLEDESGYSADIGIRGAIGFAIQYDFGAYIQLYKNRIGEIFLQDSVTFNLYRYRTNLANSRSVGVEGYIGINLNEWLQVDSENWNFSTFLNGALTDARYIQTDNTAILNKQVEYVPPINVKYGLDIRYKKNKLSYQLTHASKHFSDATNATRTPTAIAGIIPDYWVMDVSYSTSLTNRLTVGAHVNNLANASYFTQRATNYPGPGIIPADGRTFTMNIELKL